MGERRDRHEAQVAAALRRFTILGIVRGEIAEGILAGIAAAEALPPSEVPHLPEHAPRRPGSEALADLLRVLLKAKADSEGVAQRLIASSAELDALAAGETEGLPALHGWRLEVFGRDALRLIRGEVALSAENGAVKVVPLR